MISITTWDTLFQGKYASQELTILYKEDTFVSLLKSRDQGNALIQVYKVFNVLGDTEVFTQTLPYPAILYQKHNDIGENNTFKYLLLNSDIKYIDTNTISYHVDNQIQKLNKRVGSIVSIVKSYDIKLISLKLASKEVRDNFFSDPMVAKLLTNLPLSVDFSSASSIDKLIIGRKDNVPITTTLESTKSLSVFGGNLDERLFAIKVFCENYLLSSRTVIIFDNTNMFRSLSYPQQQQELLVEYDLKMDSFGFPAKIKKYFDIKIPLSKIPRKAFVNMFNLSEITDKILEKVYDNTLKTIVDLIEKVSKIEVTEQITEFEKQRVISKLLIIENKYGYRFGDTDISSLFENRYKHIGSIKILSIDVSDPFSSYYIYIILSSILLYIKDEILIVFPESAKLFNNIFVGDKVLSLLKNNSRISYILSSPRKTDFREETLSDVEIDVIKDNEAVIRYPNRDPLRLLLRPTLTSSNIKFKKISA